MTTIEPLECPECEEHPTYEATNYGNGKSYQFYCCACKKIKDNGKTMSKDGLTNIWNERVKRILKVRKVI